MVEPSSGCLVASSRETALSTGGFDYLDRARSTGHEMVNLGDTVTVAMSGGQQLAPKDTPRDSQKTKGCLYLAFMLAVIRVVEHLAHSTRPWCIPSTANTNQGSCTSCTRLRDWDLRHRLLYPQ